MSDDGRICQRCGTRYHKGIAHEKRCAAENVDELRLALNAAEARSKRWKRAEDVAFWACMLSSGAMLSDHLWVRFIAWLSLFAWVLTLALHSQVLRAEHRAHAQWGDAFYGRGRT